MASSLLALLDDIASLLDDVSVLTKVAATKTAGVLGDDLALNAQQVSGVKAERELPVVWAVAKGSLVNKAILVPAALVISAIAPWAVTPLTCCAFRARSSPSTPAVFFAATLVRTETSSSRVVMSSRRASRLDAMGSFVVFVGSLS